MTGRHQRSLDVVLRGLGEGVDPTLLAHEALGGALAATGGSAGAVLGLVAGEPVPLATSGVVPASALECGRAALESGRLVRRREPGADVSAAEPLRAAGRVVGALVVTGSLDDLDPGPLPVWAAATGLVVARRRTTTPDVLPDLLESLSAVAADLDPHSMVGRMFDAAYQLFGAAAGLFALADGGTMRVTHHRGLEATRVLGASRLPGFKDLLSSRDVRVVAGDDPLVAQLGRPDEVVAGMPLEVAGRRMGQLVLLLPVAPDAGGRALLGAFARHLAIGLGAARLSADLRDQREQLTSVVHAIADPVVVVDGSGHLAEINGAAAGAFHLATGFERGQAVAGRLGCPVVEDLLSSGEERSVEVVLGDEEPRVYRAAVRRIHTTTGRAAGRIVVLDDLTSLRQAAAVKADFVAVMGHELRTPLTVVKGYLHTLLRRGADLSEERRGQALAAVQSNVVRLERLIEDLLFISAIEQREAALDLERRDLGALLADRTGGRVVLRRPPEPVEIDVDVAKLDQVVRHLVDNALKYSEDEVVVELAERDDTVEISVADSGPGIFSGDVLRLFERFRQLDGTATRAHGGVGIGLYICRRVVEAMGGRIWCDSRLGVGSRFVFTLPKVPPRATREPIGAAAPS